MTASLQKSTHSARYQVGEVQSQSYGADIRSGHGFVISNAKSIPIASLTYATIEEAEEARETILQAVQSTVDITSYRL